MAEGQQRPLIFISYSSFDTETKEFVQRHFGVLQTLGDIEVWEDNQIGLGGDWFNEIQTKLESCSVAVLLISHDFLGSQFCMKQEVPALLERRRRDGMMIAPILLSPCAWQIVPWLRAIQMLPQKGKPLLALDELEQAEKLTEVVVAIHDFLEERKAKAGEPDGQSEIEVKADTHYAPLAKDRIDLTRLPTSGFDMVGRDKELQFLNEAFDGAKLNVVSLRAWGGVGKSTLVNKWCEYLAADNFRGATRVFAWSFYSQGTNERVTSADAFIDEALRFFKDKDPTAGSPWAKGERLAELVGKEKALIILDGMEPLQDEHQGIKDPALARLVECLAEENVGLCVITTREPVKEFADFPDTTEEVDLEQLSKEAGRALLRIKGLRATDDLLEQASEAFGNHALALNLLASYLKRFAGGDVSQALAIPDLSDDTVDDGKHPRRVMAVFAEQFGEGPELDLLHVMGLFDRPADAGCIAALREGPAVSGLTERLSELDEIDWRELLEKLRGLGLIAEAGHHAPEELDTHPLVREHFGAWLQAKRERVWKAGHDRLYKHLKNVPEEHQPETLIEMAPLFQAVHHGCQAGRLKEAYFVIYQGRISRDNSFYLTRRLGAFGSNLALIAAFCDTPWERFSADLDEESQAWLLNEAAYSLRALGRLNEAVAPMWASMESDIARLDLTGAAVSASGLSELYLALGNIKAAVAAAQAARNHADHGGDIFQRISKRSALADVLHQSGQITEAKEFFEIAETMQARRQSDYKKLYSIQGYQYCDLLLTLGEIESVFERASLTLSWMTQDPNAPLLTLAVDHLTLGSVALKLGDRVQAKSELQLAVDGLRDAGEIEFVTRGLLTRAVFFREVKEYAQSRRDLDEVMRIAKRCGMRLYKCDAHLEYARLALAEGNPDAALPHFRVADDLVTECGYHRRAPEVAELKEELGL